MRLKVALVLLATVSCLVVVLWGIDPSEAAATVAGVEPLAIVAVLGGFYVAHLLRCLRLGTLLAVPGLGFWRLLVVNSVGYLAINVVPLRLGEMVRPYLLEVRDGVPFARTLAVVILERLLDAATMVAMLAGIAFLIDVPEGGAVVQGVDVLAVGRSSALLLVGAGVVGLVGVSLAGGWVERRLARTERFAGLGRFVGRFRQALADLVASPARAAAAVALTVAIWGVTVLGVQALMAGFPGVPATFGGAWSVWALILAGTTALPTPGFFGSYEAAGAAALWWMGVPLDTGRTFALLLHLCMFGLAVGNGAIFVALEGLDLRKVVADSRARAA